MKTKYPYNYKDGFEGWQEDEKFLLGEDWTVKTEHPYYYQIELQHELYDAESGYLYIYSPAEKKELCSLVHRNFCFLSKLKENLFGIFKRFALLEFVTRENGIEAAQKRGSCCTRKRSKYGRIICCSNKNCDEVWYHYSCVNMIRAPQKKSNCNNCRSLKL